MLRGTGEGLSVGAPFGWREWLMGLIVVRGRWGAREKVSWCFGCGRDRDKRLKQRWWENQKDGRKVKGRNTHTDITQTDSVLVGPEAIALHRGKGPFIVSGSTRCSMFPVAECRIRIKAAPMFY